MVKIDGAERKRICTVESSGFSKNSFYTLKNGKLTVDFIYVICEREPEKCFQMTVGRIGSYEQWKPDW